MNSADFAIKMLVLVFLLVLFLSGKKGAEFLFSTIYFGVGGGDYDDGCCGG